MSFDLRLPDGGPWHELFPWLGFTWLPGMRMFKSFSTALPLKAVHDLAELGRQGVTLFGHPAGSG